MYSRQRNSLTYFLRSELSSDNFRVFAICSMAEGAVLLTEADWMHSGSAYKWAEAEALEHPVAFGLDVLYSKHSTTPA